MILKEFLFTCIHDKICRTYTISVLIVTSIFLILFLWWMNAIYSPLITNSPSAKPVSILYTQGTSVKAFANRLHKDNILKHPNAFVFLARIRNATRLLHYGEYEITPGLSASGLLNKMISGDVVSHAFTIVEGWTFSQVLTALNNNPYIQHTLSSNVNAIMKFLGHDGEFPEGRFAPDTYLFSGLTKDTDILRTAYILMQKRFDQEWSSRDTTVNYSCQHEVLTIASMIEKESSFLPERPLIAGVILKRLQLGMPLQIDSTVIYGLGKKYSGKLTSEDMQQNTAYNTYSNKGLPPSPIAMPSQNAIHATLHPKITDALYFVAKGDGSHEFSNTLQQHDVAIKKYLQSN